MLCYCFDFFCIFSVCLMCLFMFFLRLFFFFKQKTAYEMRISDWSSDVCSSDLFGAISWPWLLASLSGGRKADKRALLDELGLPHDALPHLGSWKADMGFLRHIVREIARLRPAHVVELGAGATTLHAARALALHGGGRLTSFDPPDGFRTANTNCLATHGHTSPT